VHAPATQTDFFNIFSFILRCKLSRDAVTSGREREREGAEEDRLGEVMQKTQQAKLQTVCM